MKTKPILIPVLCLLSSGFAGCQYRSFTAPNGVSYKSVGLGTSSQLNGLDATIDPQTGTFSVKVKSATNDNTAVAAEALALAAKALAPK